MARRNEQQTQRRSLTTTLVGLAVVVVLVILTQLTGIDFLEIAGVTTAVPTATPSPTATLTSVPTMTFTPAPTRVASAPGEVEELAVGQGFGAEKDFWQVYFDAPTGSSDSATYVDGIDVPLANAINGVQRTLDIAAFEFNNAVLTEAILNAKARGVEVRIVTDDEHGVEDENDPSLGQFAEAGIPIVDDERSDLMHNKFMILDSTTVWTGSWNYTVNGTYRNNNNALVLRSQRAVQAYQAEFDEMFDRHQFGPTSSTGNGASFTQDGVPIQILFASEDAVAEAILAELQQADTSIRFMTYVMSLDELGQAIIERAAAGVAVQGIFEDRNSTAGWSELPALYCAGLSMRQDGNKYILHHKVMIIDDETVITGSYNFSASAEDSNDENVVIITDPDLAAQYIAEFERRWAEATEVEAGDITCD